MTPYSMISTATLGAIAQPIRANVPPKEQPITIHLILAYLVISPDIGALIKCKSEYLINKNTINLIVLQKSSLSPD